MKTGCIKSPSTVQNEYYISLLIYQQFSFDEVSSESSRAINNADFRAIDISDNFRIQLFLCRKEKMLRMKAEFCMQQEKCRTTLENTKRSYSLFFSHCSISFFSYSSTATYFAKEITMLKPPQTKNPRNDKFRQINVPRVYRFVLPFFFWLTLTYRRV